MHGSLVTRVTFHKEASNHDENEKRAGGDREVSG